MRAIAKRNRFEGCPAAIAAFGYPQSETNISNGKDYEVHALSVFQGVVCLQIVNDLNIITWLPAWFFEVCDGSVPEDWTCNLPGGDLQMILGPSFVSVDEASYNRMVELDSTSVSKFWQRVEAKPIRQE